MTYDKFKEIDKKLERRVDYLSMKLNFYPKAKNGMVLQSYRGSKEYQKTAAEFQAIFKLLQQHRRKHKKFSKKYSLERRPAWRIKK